MLVGDEGELLADEVSRVKVDSTSPRGDYRRYYDDRLTEGVAELYRRDLDLFGYGF